MEKESQKKRLKVRGRIKCRGYGKEAVKKGLLEHLELQSKKLFFLFMKRVMYENLEELQNAAIIVPICCQGYTQVHRIYNTGHLEGALLSS